MRPSEPTLWPERLGVGSQTHFPLPKPQSSALDSSAPCLSATFDLALPGWQRWRGRTGRLLEMNRACVGRQGKRLHIADPCRRAFPGCSLATPQYRLRLLDPWFDDVLVRPRLGLVEKQHWLCQSIRGIAHNRARACFLRRRCRFVLASHSMRLRGRKKRRAARKRSIGPNRIPVLSERRRWFEKKMAS